MYTHLVSRNRVDAFTLKAVCVLQVTSTSRMSESNQCFAGVFPGAIVNSTPATPW